MVVLPFSCPYFATKYRRKETLMRAKAMKKKTTRERADRRKQVNIRVELALYQALQVLARQEQRSLPQAARQLMEEGLRQRMGGRAIVDDTPGQEIAALVAAGGAFDWLAEEPDLYNDTCGEPL
jgi:hypothetical protein